MQHEHKLKLFTCKASKDFALKVAKALNIPIGSSDVLTFSDGEFQPCYNESVRGATVFIIQSTPPPSDTLFELLLMIGIGGIALKSPFVMQTLSDVLNMPIKVCNTDQACALGAAMCAATAAGAYPDVEAARDAMNSGFAHEYQPIAENVKVYDELYRDYLAFGEFVESQVK